MSFMDLSTLATNTNAGCDFLVFKNPRLMLKKITSSSILFLHHMILAKNHITVMAILKQYINNCTMLFLALAVWITLLFFIIPGD